MEPTFEVQVDLWRVGNMDLPFILWLEEELEEKLCNIELLSDKTFRKEKSVTVIIV